MASCNKLNTKDIFYPDDSIPATWNEKDCIEMMDYIISGDKNAYDKFSKSGKEVGIYKDYSFRIITIHDRCCQVVTTLLNDTLWIPKKLIITEEEYKAREKYQYYKKQKALRDFHEQFGGLK